MISAEKSDLNTKPVRVLSDVDVGIPYDLETITARKRRRDQRSVCETNKLGYEAMARLPKDCCICFLFFKTLSVAMRSSTLAVKVWAEPR